MEGCFLSRICAQGARVQSALGTNKPRGVPRHLLKAFRFLKEPDDWICINVDATMELECV